MRMCGVFSTLSLTGMLLIIFTALSGTDGQSYEPECVAWDRTISQIQLSLNSIGGSAACTKSADCTSMTCMFYFWGKQLSIDVKLYPCDIPAQMRLRVGSPTGNLNFEQSVTHGDTYNLPGFQYVPFPLMPKFNLAVVLVVHFERVLNGLKVGLRLETRGLGKLGWPLMPDTIVPTPPCPTATPSQCMKMDELIQNMVAPQGFICTPADSCVGFSCNGNIKILQFVEYDLNATLVVNSCDNPISYTVTLISNEARLKYTHKFTHSDSVPVKGAGMPAGTTANLTVLMIPSLNLDSIDTSITLDICMGPLPIILPRRECYSAPLLSHQPVPIPPCVPPTVGAPLPAVNKPPTTGKDAECDAWNVMENNLLHTSLPGYGFDTCHTNLNCMGLTCHAIYEQNDYTLYLELYNCADPMILRIKVDCPATDFHYAQNVTENSTFAINEKLSVNIHFYPVTAGVVIGGSVTSLALGPGAPITIPVITDRAMPLPSCSGQPTLKPFKTDVPFQTRKSGESLLDDSTTSYDDDAPKQDQLKQGGVNGLVVGVAVGVAAFFTVVVLGAMYHVSRQRRRTRRHEDEVVLVGDRSGGTSTA